MAYATGTGANQQDFLDAVRSFALGLGWTIVLWDTVNKRLYLEKGVCHVALQWSNSDIYTYNYGNSTPIIVSEGRILGSLSQSLSAASLDYSTFPGSAIASGQLNSGPNVTMRQMQGPFVQWFLFSNATGDYIHAIVQVTSDQYCHIGFGNADKGGLTHSGAAYFHSDGGRKWFRDSYYDLPTSDSYYANDPGYAACYFTRMTMLNGAVSLQVYSENALPAGFLNQQAFAMGANSFYSAYIRSMASPMPLRTLGTNFSKPSEYPRSGNGACLLDALISSNAPAYSNFVPMFGLPLIVTNELRTQTCALGSIPDLRMINMEGMSPQQEITLGADTWKVFPQHKQSNWDEVKLTDAPTSGQYALAYKKIV